MSYKTNDLLIMALNKPLGAHIIFLQIADGKIVRQHKESTPETTQRTTKTGKVVHEEFYKDLTGYIRNITTKENDYGKQWQISFADSEDLYVVSMPYSSRYAASFLKALPNVDAKEPVRFMPWSMIDKNDPMKKITGITMYQNDVKVLAAFTKEDPNGLPQMKKIKIKGKEQWDDSDMMEFLESSAMDWQKGIQETLVKKEVAAIVEDAANPESNPDDLPF